MFRAMHLNIFTFVRKPAYLKYYDELLKLIEKKLSFMVYEFSLSWNKIFSNGLYMILYMSQWRLAWEPPCECRRNGICGSVGTFTSHIIIWQTIGTNQVQKILHDRFDVRNLCYRWISQDLTNAQKCRPIDYCRQMLLSFGGGTTNTDIFTGVETRVYDPDTNKRYAQCVFPMAI